MIQYLVVKPKFYHELFNDHVLTILYDCIDIVNELLNTLFSPKYIIV